MIGNVYEPHACVCVFDSAPRDYPHQTREDKTARRRYECKITHLRFHCFMSSVLLLLLLLRIRYIYNNNEIKSERICFVYELLSGGWG